MLCMHRLRLHHRLQLEHLTALACFRHGAVTPPALSGYCGVKSSVAQSQYHPYSSFRYSLFPSTSTEYSTLDTKIIFRPHRGWVFELEFEITS
jgi:hypothetical protein